MDSRAIVNAEGVVLSRTDWGEADRLATLYTELHGRVPVRFVGVNRPRAKLRCLCEPLNRVELRIHLGGRSGHAKAIGGRIIESFPGVRGDLRRTLEGLALAEMLMSLTPDMSPNEDEYRLIVSALETLEAAPTPWVVAAFGLRLLGLAGVGLSKAVVPGVDPPLWEALHARPWERLGGLPFETAAAGRVLTLMHEAFEAQAGREIRALTFLAQAPGFEFGKAFAAKPGA
ncbi:MAG: DNA repair protein RecO [Elusimicrobia bacterium]|nr:DNA repair protein RecO [Elusimicrobiota bacterium]